MDKRRLKDRLLSSKDSHTLIEIRPVPDELAEFSSIYVQLNSVFLATDGVVELGAYIITSCSYRKYI